MLNKKELKTIATLCGIGINKCYDTINNTAKWENQHDVDVANIRLVEYNELREKVWKM
jgi:hypothetical protein